MKVEFLTHCRYRFPGRAGELQAAGATAALIGELGDNYEVYHAAIREAFETVGGIPQPTGQRRDLEAYCNQWATVQYLVMAEMGLRRAHQIRQRLPELPDGAVPGPAVIDPDGGLTSVTTVDDGAVTTGAEDRTTGE